MLSNAFPWARLRAFWLMALVLFAGCRFGPPVSPTSPYFSNEGKSGPEARRNGDRFFHTAFARAVGIRDVSADLTRQELIGSSVQGPETIHWVQRVEPHSLHLIWTGNRLGGREVLFVEGANDGKVLVRLPGLQGRLTGTLRLSPTSPAAKWGSRYPVTVVGYDALVKRIVEHYDKAARAGTLGVVDFGAQDLFGRQMRAFKAVLDYPDSQKGDYHSMLVWFDLETGLPVRFVGLNVKDCLLEDYQWQNLKINQDLTDADFTLGNGPDTPEAPPLPPKSPETTQPKPPETPQPEPSETPLGGPGLK